MGKLREGELQQEPRPPSAGHQRVEESVSIQCATLWPAREKKRTRKLKSLLSLENIKMNTSVIPFMMVLLCDIIFLKNITLAFFFF
jgi:hypothetical protein